MDSRYFKLKDLKAWNHLQMRMIRDLDIPQQPDYITGVAEWFVSLVDQMGRLPSWEEILTFFPAETTADKKTY